MVDDTSADQVVGVTVLVVDDDPAIRELLRDLLGTEGYEVVEAANGAEALDRVHRHMPAAVLMDLMMPIMSGAEATHRLKSDPITAAIPVLAMSAGRNLTAVGLDIPADDCVAKPFDLDDLVVIIGQYVSQAIAAS